MDFRKKMRAIVLRLRQELELDQRSFGKKLGKSPGAVQGWEREAATTFPDFDSLAAIAELRGQLPEELVAELYDRTYAPTGDRTWAEIGATMSDRDYEELHSSLPTEELVRKAGILNKILQHRFPNSENP